MLFMSPRGKLEFNMDIYWCSFCAPGAPSLCWCLCYRVQAGGVQRKCEHKFPRSRRVTERVRFVIMGNPVLALGSSGGSIVEFLLLTFSHGQNNRTLAAGPGTTNSDLLVPLVRRHLMILMLAGNWG